MLKMQLASMSYKSPQAAVTHCNTPVAIHGELVAGGEVGIIGT